jgi:hypothetical protein
MTLRSMDFEEMARREAANTSPPRPDDEAACAVMRETYAAIGEDFLRRLVCRMAAALDVRYAFVTGPVRNAATPSGRPALGVWLARDFGLRAAFAATPQPWRTATPASDPLDYVPVLRTLYPDERRLGDVDPGEARGVALVSARGRLLGHLGTLDPGPAADPEETDALLFALRTRAAAEIERHAAEDRHRLALARLRAGRRRGGLLTACAWCRRVRDERKDWLDLEDYMRRHLALDLTHGICGDCLRRHQPDGGRE